MKGSPFIYGTTVSQKAFTNREKETEKLYSNLVNGINTMIISPRRWGKSSLVEKVIHDIDKREQNTRTLVIDLFSVSTEEEFLETFAKEVIKASSNKFQEWLTAGRDFFKQLIPKLSVGLDPQTDFSLSFDWNELKEHSAEIFNLPELIAQKKDIHFIICLDEFQNLALFKEFAAFEKKMRSVWQRQKRVTYCMYGSKRHMMDDIFNTPSKPFYRFGDLMFLQKIAAEKWIPFIINGFSLSGKKINESTAALIPAMMKDHPWYVQQLAHYTWNLTQKTAGRAEVMQALTELMQANTPLYQKEAESLSPTQLNLLKAILKGERLLMGTHAMQTYQLGTPRNISKNKTILIKNDMISESQGKFELLDPAFERWFRKQYFEEDWTKMK